jgi:hypothetical protein
MVLMSIIPALKRQEDYEFKASQDYIVRPCLKKKELDVLKWNLGTWHGGMIGEI